MPVMVGAASENWGRNSVSKEIWDKPQAMPKLIVPCWEGEETSQLAM